MHSPAEETRKSTAQELWDILKFIVLAIVIVIPIRMFIFQPFVVSGESMYPTFHDADYLIVDEFSYYFHEPKRGDVIIFHYPNDPKKYFIKRVI
jgi:signal peptidase I